MVLEGTSRASRAGRRVGVSAIVVVLVATAHIALAATGTVTTVAGNGTSLFSGDGGPASAAGLAVPIAVTATADGGYLIADQGHSRIRRVAPDGTITTVAGSGVSGFGGDGGPATSAQLNAPSGSAQLPDGTILIADSNNNRVRRVAPDGTITTVAGGGVGINDGGAATAAQLAFPADLALTADGGYLIADIDNNRIRKVLGGTITTVAGTGAAASGGDGGAATAAQLNRPSAVASTADGGFLVTEQQGRRVRKVAPDGTITTVAGNGSPGSTGDGGPATSASISAPDRLAVLVDGGFLIADRAGQRIRRVAPDGTISTVAGSGVAGYSGDGAAAVSAQFNNPFGIAVDAGGDILVADTANRRIRLIDFGEPQSPPPPPPPSERNLTRPEIIEDGRQGRRAIYRCTDGTWAGLAANPGFQYSWWEPLPVTRRGLFRPPRLVANGPTIVLSTADQGKSFFCRVQARSASGGTVTAESDIWLLTGRPAGLLPNLPKPTPTYGDLRVRGIDIYQTVQPNPGARRFGFPSGAFPTLCGGGTPTSYRQFFGTVTPTCSLEGRDPGRTQYVGVPLVVRKPTVAVVFVDMVNARASDPSQPVDVTLRARLGGRLLAGSVTRQMSNIPVTLSPFVSASDRADGAYGVQLDVPSSWLGAAALSGRPLDFEATAELPLGAGGGSLVECAIVTTSCNTANNRFQLDGVTVFDDLAELTVRSIQLVQNNQTLNTPDRVLNSVVDLFPGGERLDVQPFSATINIQTAANLQLTDNACSAFRAVPDNPATPVNESRPANLRGCRSAAVNAAVDVWLAAGLQNRTGFNVLAAIHSYGGEPGWARGGTVETPDQPPIITINDGSLGRPLTAAAHEFGHALGAPHADNRPVDANGNNTPDPVTGSGCGGNINGQVGEPWPPDQSGRLQGTAFGQNNGLARTRNPIVDSDLTSAGARPLFDLMSYCANNDVNAWLSPFNWNRFLTVMRNVRAANVQAAAHDHESHAQQVGSGFVSGTVGPGGATIQQVVPADPENAVPADAPTSSLRVRSFDASGNPLPEVGATIAPMHLDGNTSPVATFTAPLPAGARRVEVVSSGVVTDSVTGSGSPTVRLVAPSAGARVRGGIGVRWVSRDPDTGTSLTASVQFAPDGRTFRTVFTGPDTGRATVPARALSVSRRARVRVIISDGFNHARATSGQFSVAGAPPVARIVAPSPRERLQAGTGVLLVGAAIDDTRRRLTGRALTWFAGNRRLGTGNRLRTTLPAGLVTLRLVARDRQGRTTTLTRRIRVAPVALALTTLRVPRKVGPGARSVTLTVATRVPATLRVGGRAFSVGPAARTIVIPLAANPRVGVLRLPMRIAAGGVRQPNLREVIVLTRI